MAPTDRDPPTTNNDFTAICNLIYQDLKKAWDSRVADQKFIMRQVPTERLATFVRSASTCASERWPVASPPDIRKAIQAAAYQFAVATDPSFKLDDDRDKEHRRRMEVLDAERQRHEQHHQEALRAAEARKAAEEARLREQRERQVALQSAAEGW